MEEKDGERLNRRSIIWEGKRKRAIALKMGAKRWGDAFLHQSTLEGARGGGGGGPKQGFYYPEQTRRGRRGGELVFGARARRWR